MYRRPHNGRGCARPALILRRRVLAPCAHLAERGDDPFINNTVQPGLTSTVPQYGCTGILETGDPSRSHRLLEGTNTSGRARPPGASRSPTAPTTGGRGLCLG